MLHETSQNLGNSVDLSRIDYDQPIEKRRWEAIRNRVIDELSKSNGRTREDFAKACDIAVGQLEIWLKSSEYFPQFGRGTGSVGWDVVTQP